MTHRAQPRSAPIGRAPIPPLPPAAAQINAMVVAAHRENAMYFSTSPGAHPVGQIKLRRINGWRKIAVALREYTSVAP
jgi:nitrate reductase alpha subunit